MIRADAAACIQERVAVAMHKSNPRDAATRKLQAQMAAHASARAGFFTATEERQSAAYYDRNCQYSSVW
jgi:hypothetical protein